MTRGVRYYRISPNVCRINRGGRGLLITPEALVAFCHIRRPGTATEMLKNALKTGPRCSLTRSLDEGVVRGKLVLNLFVPLRPGRWADATAMQLLLAYYYIIGGLAVNEAS